VVTAADACADFDLGRHEASLRKVDQSFGWVVPTQRIVDVWATAAAPAAGAGGQRVAARA
jgi:isochorismate hydrolase